MSEEPSPLGVIPYLQSPDCQKHLQWLENSLGGKTRQLLFTDESKSKVMHSSVDINGGVLYLGDRETEANGVVDVENLVLHMGLGTGPENPDSIWKRAHAHGAITVMDLKMQSWGSW